MACCTRLETNFKPNKRWRGEEKRNLQIITGYLQKLDENKFEMLLTDVIGRLKANKQTESYAKYFEHNYVNNTSARAYCFPKNSGLNLNTHLESLHRTLKYVYLEGKKVKRVNKTISILMKVIFNRFYNQRIITHKGKLTKKIQDLRRCHCTAVKASNPVTYDENDER